MDKDTDAIAKASRVRRWINFATHKVEMGLMKEENDEVTVMFANPLNHVELSLTREQFEGLKRLLRKRPKSWMRRVSV